MIMKTGRLRRCKFSYISFLLVIVLLGLLFLNLYTYRRETAGEDYKLQHKENMGENSARTRPVVLLVVDEEDEAALKLILYSFEQSGFTTRTERGLKISGIWHVLWSYKTPFPALNAKLVNMEPYQRVNHFPGSNIFTDKYKLGTSRRKFAPQGFELPSQRNQFVSYQRRHPHVPWMQHRKKYTRLKKEVKQFSEMNESIVEKFVGKPFLIDGYKFDIGIFTILTSIKPLRVYVFEDDVLIRFCREKYSPFDPDARDKCVVQSQHLPLWRIPSLTDMFADKGFNFKTTLFQYMTSKRLDYGKVWSDMISAIKQVYQESEPTMISNTSTFPSTECFFEINHFDFILDENLNVFLVEADESPSFSSLHHPLYTQLYQRVIFNFIGLAGLMETFSLAGKSEHEEAVLVSASDIYVHPEECSRNFCDKLTSCVRYVQCKLCPRCLRLLPGLVRTLKKAYLEHMRRGPARRILPPPINESQIKLWYPFSPWLPVSAGTRYRRSKLSKENELMYRWFYGKCKQDPSFCF